MAIKIDYEFIKSEEAKEIFPEITNIYNFGNMSQKPSMIIRAEDKKILRS